MNSVVPVRFSVVIPAFNEQAGLPRTLDALAAQDFRGRIEVIVVDNNCTDDTAAIAERSGAVVVRETTPGVCHARQAGTAVARGEIVVSTDADTIQPAGWLSRIDQQFRADATIVAIAGPCRYVDGPVWASSFSRLIFGGVELGRRISGRVVYVTATNLAFRRSAWSGYDTRLTQGGDELDLLRRLKRHGRVQFDRTNVVRTSARRLEGGVLHSLVVCLLFQYLLGYCLNRLVGRPLIPTAPPVRPGSSDALNRPMVALRLGLVGILVIIAALLLPDAVADLGPRLDWLASKR